MSIRSNPPKCLASVWAARYRWADLASAPTLHAPYLRLAIEATGGDFSLSRSRTMHVNEGTIRATLSIALFAPAAALAQATAPVRVDLSEERAGAEPAKFLPMVGNWVIARDDNKNVVMVDGRAWKRG